MDGVLANFTKAACSQLNIEYPKEKVFDGTNQWLDNTVKEKFGNIGYLWAKCQGHKFWVDIEPYPWAYRIHQLVKSYDPDFKYLTKPSCDGGCYSGKYDWIQKHFGDANQRLCLINGDKSILANGFGDVLIDDNLKNITSWKKRGNVFFWHEVTDDYPYPLIEEKLKNLDNSLESVLNGATKTPVYSD